LYTWTFSPDARWLAWSGASDAPDTTYVQPVTGGSRRPVARNAALKWLAGNAALIQRFKADGLTPQGSWYATFH
jgi:hypothetical protein